MNFADLFEEKEILVIMIINIKDFNALGDGKTINTSAIQNAIDKCYESGGGTINISSGTFITGTLELKSNITLNLEQGAILRGSGDMQDYRYNGFYHNEMKETLSLLYAIDQHDIHITGEGIIDLSGDAFMDYSKVFHPEYLPEKLSFEQFNETECFVKERPNQPIFFHNCHNIKIDGIKIINSPCWTISISTSKHINISHLTIVNNMRVPNSDGIHISASSDVIITDCSLYCGDDCIALTGITNWDVVCEHIIISNCLLVTRSSGIRIGNLSSKIRDVVISNLIIYNSNRGIGIWADGKNGWVKNINISNIIMETHIFAGTWWGKGEPLVISAAGDYDGTNVIENVSVKNVKACSENGIVLIGNGKNIKNILLQDWEIKLQYNVDNRPYFCKKIDIQPAEMIIAPNNGEDIPWIYANDIDKLTLKDIYYSKETIVQKSFGIEDVMKNTLSLQINNVVRI